MASPAIALTLEQIRRRQGVSLDEIANSTKISTHFLSAIETEQFGKLPGGLFSRSYIRQYAAALEIPEADILDRFAAFEAEQAAKEHAAPAIRQRRPHRLRWIASLIASIIAISPRNS